MGASAPQRDDSVDVGRDGTARSDLVGSHTSTGNTTSSIETSDRDGGNRLDAAESDSRHQPSGAATVSAVYRDAVPVHRRGQSIEYRAGVCLADIVFVDNCDTNCCRRLHAPTQS